MKKILFPGTFYIGSDILNDFASIACNYGKCFVFIGGKTALSVSKDAVEASFSGTDLKYSFVICGKICSEAEVARVEALPEINEAEVICALGESSCMDIAMLIAVIGGGGVSWPLYDRFNHPRYCLQGNWFRYLPDKSGIEIFITFWHGMGWENGKPVRKIPDDDGMTTIDSGLLAAAFAAVISAVAVSAFRAYPECFFSVCFPCR